MKFLICLGGVEPSAETIRFGGNIVKAFEADVAVLSVQPRAPHAVRAEVRLAREKMSEWHIDSPGIAVLRAARAILIGEGFVDPRKEGAVPEGGPLPDGRFELELDGPHGEDVRLRLREGDVIAEVNKEIEAYGPDLVIFGASRGRRFLPRLVHFVDCSMLIVKNPRDVAYELVICTDSSPVSRKAEVFGSNVARMLECRVSILSIAKSKSREHQAMEGAERASKMLAKARIRHSVAVRVGNVVDLIAAAARPDTVLVMGASRASEFRQFFFGSKPAKIIGLVDCPVLIVK